MTLSDLILAVHARLKSDCFSDIVESTEISPSTIWKWRTCPPGRPSLRVFIKLAYYCGFNPTAEQLEPLL